MHEVYGLSDIGIARQNNEDLFASMLELDFFALCDGMGGHNAGEIAAKETLFDLCKAAIALRKEAVDPKRLIFKLRDTIKKTNRRIYDMGRDNSAFHGMGTTLCCLFLNNSQAICAHVGDSRIYRYSRGSLLRLTEDHSLKNKLIKQGEIMEEDVLPPPYNHIITKAIGPALAIEPSIRSCQVAQGDILFLCSDGLSDHLPESDMEKILQEKSPLKKKAEQLILAAKEAGSRDNITILMVRV